MPVPEVEKGPLGTRSQVSLPIATSGEFKIYDAAVAKTSLTIASSSLSIFFVIISACVTFES